MSATATALAKIGSDFTKSDVGKKTVKILIVTIVLALIFFLVRAIARNIGGTITNFFEEQNLQQIVDNTPTIDGTDFENNSEENAFKAQARVIADAQYQAMAGGGTNETQLYTGLLNLNGAQLQLVFSEYGKKDGYNLFEWYSGDISDWYSVQWNNSEIIYGLTYEDIAPYVATHGKDKGEMPFWAGGSEGWGISERALMRAIWEKSGLPLTF
jgi:hypothetical protein